MVLGEQDGWVIEHFNSPESAPSYWDGVSWSANHLRAIRFLRSIDATRVRNETLMDERHRIAEHIWS